MPCGNIVKIGALELTLRFRTQYNPNMFYGSRSRRVKLEVGEKPTLPPQR